MKRFIKAILMVGLASSVAWADWLGDFKDNYTTKGIDVAVEKALKDGVGPDRIVQNGLAFENLNPQNLVKALYCAGVSGKDVYVAAEKNNISELIVAAGFNKSVEECSDVVADTQPYTPGKQRPSHGFGGPPSTPRGRPFASPSRF